MVPFRVSPITSWILPFFAGSLSAASAARQRPKHPAQGMTTSNPIFSARARFRAGNAKASSSSVAWAALAPQQFQSGISINSRSSASATAWVDRPYSSPVEFKEQPGKKAKLLIDSLIVFRSFLRGHSRSTSPGNYPAQDFSAFNAARKQMHFSSAQQCRR